ncbi:glycosyltransferase family 2 protein [Microbacterium sp. SORGH_AS_0888]|uniref:glycosyltransferase n=1 Tax=Microbacterium sp. SORGH_AS_0888 TaxID=3041791 RepID=UPI00277F633F|nr:glycosyltransferase family 2 protein [Microbacterium sp. SORGH_AS_0888]MDQ1128914.1 glycosyltransferase involved in cell wall biosynthesis [Microbacterium sp. SORGH_AS_0888]
MPSPIRIAVVIPCRDDAHMLDACLTALAAQTRPADLVLVVDNASTDDSADVARRHGVELAEQPRVGIWPAAATGYDLVRDRADVIARIDADSRPHPDWIARIERAFLADPGLGVLTGGAQFYDVDPVRAYLGAHWYIGGGRFWVKAWLGIPLVFGSNFAMRTAIWERVRTEVRRDDARVHDDLDLTIHLRASDGVRWDRDLRMPVSARPITSVRALARRVWRVVPTFAASWPRGRFRAAVREDQPPEPWGEPDDLAPHYGR